MKQHNSILVDNSLQKAEESLQSAKLNLDNNLLTAAQNRIYYAIFYAVTALGYSEDHVLSKHSGLLSWFNKKFIKDNKIFDVRLAKIYKRAYENRSKSDYEYIWKPNKDDLLADIEDARYFVSTIKDYILNN